MFRTTKVAFDALSIGGMTISLTVPIGGGRVATAINASQLGLNVIDAIISVRIIEANPPIDNIYVPQVSINGNVVGITVTAGAGTTVNVEILAMGK